MTWLPEVTFLGTKREPQFTQNSIRFHIPTRFYFLYEETAVNTHRQQRLNSGERGNHALPLAQLLTVVSSDISGLVFSRFSVITHKGHLKNK